MDPHTPEFSPGRIVWMVAAMLALYHQYRLTRAGT